MAKDASAQLSYTYTGVVSGSTASVNGTYTVGANSSVVVNLYLVEVANGTPSMIAAAGGLYAGSVNTTLQSVSGSAAATSITAAAINGAPEPDGFTGNNTVTKYNNIGPVGGTGSSASIQGITSNNVPNPPGPSGTTVGGIIQTNGATTTTYVWLGSVTIAVGASANSKYSVTSFHNAPVGTMGHNTNENTLLADNASLNTADADSTNNAGNAPNPSYYQAYTGADGNGGFFVLQTSGGSVPEPSSMLLCGLAACSMGFGGYWRRRKQRLAAAAEQTETPAIA